MKSHQDSQMISLLWLWPVACAIPLAIRALLSPMGKDIPILQASPILLIGVFHSILWAALEAGVFAFLVLWVSSLKLSKFGKGMAFACLAVPATLYVLTVSLMWFVTLRYRAMPQIHSLALVEYLLEKTTLNIYLSFRDAILAIGAVLFAAAVVTYEVGEVSRGSSRGKNVISPTMICCLALALNIVLYGIVRTILSQEERSNIALFTANHTLPQGAVFAGIAYRSNLKTFRRVDLNLVKADVYPAPVSLSAPKNVLIIAVEAMRYDAFQPTEGQPGPLPTMNQLAKEGVSMSRAFSQAPDTEYSINTILSGCYPLRSVYRDVSSLGGEGLELPELFRRLGYRTGYLTPFDWAGMRSRAGTRYFDLYSDPTADGGGEEIERRLLEERKARGGVPKVDRQEAVARLDAENLKRFSEWIASEPRRPFFALFYLYNSHFPYNVPQDDYRESPIEEATYYFPEERSEHYWGRYLRALRYMDQLIGAMLQDLERRGVLNQTLVVITGDHGEEFYEHGGFLHVGALHQETVHVPIVYWGLPRNCSPASNALTGHVDIAPTLLDALGLPPYPGYQGRSQCRGDMENRLLFSSSQGITEEDAVYWREYKFVRNYRGMGSRFFNLRADPNERNNLVGKPENLVLSSKLSEALQNFRSQQISYYQGPSNWVREFYPPATRDLAE